MRVNVMWSENLLANQQLFRKRLSSCSTFTCAHSLRIPSCTDVFNFSSVSGQFASRNSQNYSTSPLGGGSSVGGATGQLVVTATHPFTGQQPGDLSFFPGDRITVITKTDSQYDWWEGQLDDGQVGIFPANFVTYWLLPPLVSWFFLFVFYKIIKI